MIDVLVADDHPFMRAGIEAVLRGTRYRVVATAATGPDAMDQINRHDPAICLLDVRMPLMSGVQILEALRDNGDRRAVVLLTAELSDKDLLAAVRAGANGILLKDGAEDVLLSCLDAVADGGRAIEPALLQRALDKSIGASKNSLDVLTPRERQIAELVGQGLRNRDIAARVGVTEGTVKVYLHAMYQKLGTENRTALALLVHEALG